MPARAVSRARMGIDVTFATAAALMGTWGPRLPAIKSHLGASDGQLGLALSGCAAGLLLGTRIARIPVDRFGSRAVIRVCLPLLCLTLIGPGVAGSVAWFTASLFAVGLAGGVLDVSMNIHAVSVEREMRRPIMSGIHSRWSLGILAGAGSAAAAAALRVPVAAHFSLIAVLVVLASYRPLLALLPRSFDTLEHQAELPRSRRRGVTAVVAVLGVIGFSGFMMEGAAADWTAVYLHEGLGTTQGEAALGFVAFSLGMAGSRVAGDRLVARYGPVAVVRAGGLGVAMALVASLSVDGLVTAVAGFGLVGVALGPVVPVTLGAAGNTRLGRTGTALPWVVTISYLGSTFGPALIGSAADVLSLRWALGIPAVFGLVIAVTARALGRPQSSIQR